MSITDDDLDHMLKYATPDRPDAAKRGAVVIRDLVREVRRLRGRAFTVKELRDVLVDAWGEALRSARAKGEPATYDGWEAAATAVARHVGAVVVEEKLTNETLDAALDRAKNLIATGFRSEIDVSVKIGDRFDAGSTVFDVIETDTRNAWVKAFAASNNKMVRERDVIDLRDVADHIVAGRWRRIAKPT